MFNRLEEIIKKIEGNVLIIGLDENLIKMFDKNNNVNLYSINRNFKYKSGKSDNFKRKYTSHGKNINIKHLRKYINKKSANYIIFNMNEVFKYYKYIIKDSIYLNNNKIYIYFNNDIDKDFIVKKYKRYNVKIKEFEYKNGYILEIDNTSGKNNYIKDKLYFIKDTLDNLAESIGNLLIS